MTKEEIIKALENYAPDAEVEISLCSGDNRVWREIKAVENYDGTSHYHCLIYAGKITESMEEGKPNQHYR